MQVERVSCPVDDVVMWLPDVSETLYAIVPTARDDVGSSDGLNTRDPSESVGGTQIHASARMAD